MAKKNSAEIISDMVNALQRKDVELEYRGQINVAMRIDEVKTFIHSMLELAEADQSSRKFDLTLDKTGTCTVAYQVNGETASAGANVLKYGDTLKITVTAGTGYEITKLQVNGKDYTSGTNITVDTDIAVTVIASLIKYDLSVTTDENCSVTVTKGGEAVTAGEDAISYGDVLTITATAGEGYQIATLTVNGDAFTSGNTVTVSGNVAVAATSEAVENNG